ncbi:hypothetical protein SARC_03368 [Sphaeroforma arctica JP610]|uniref:Uncharacterized protein n=1 Tax=Sphaeroforma arctica JP610 TaxID=667725 RepID=A0A0L0G6A7_9EUKA|nr:hypothetical protein SARC_03368 [Sphaeroforma arctica JP610]KNC84406.1 hypothetical protein SARC_03368 [Sphaeroforma arctica JP610]|eukprot:XP_014158308.1 hypothetical protein SARC_03368 [Sphaeroforma arctica JP610]
MYHVAHDKRNWRVVPDAVYKEDEVIGDVGKLYDSTIDEAIDFLSGYPYLKTLDITDFYIDTLEEVYDLAVAVPRLSNLLASNIILPQDKIDLFVDMLPITVVSICGKVPTNMSSLVQFVVPIAKYLLLST